jgi:hypothetical protein
MSKWGHNPLCKGYTKKFLKKFLGKNPPISGVGRILKKNFWKKIDKKSKFFYFYQKIKLWVNTRV